MAFEDIFKAKGDLPTSKELPELAYLQVIAPDANAARLFAQRMNRPPRLVTSAMQILISKRGSIYYLLIGDDREVFRYDHNGWEIRRAAAERQALGIITVMGVWL